MNMTEVGVMAMPNDRLAEIEHELSVPYTSVHGQPVLRHSQAQWLIAEVKRLRILSDAAEDVVDCARYYMSLGTQLQKKGNCF